MPQIPRHTSNDPKSIQRVGIAMFSLMLSMLAWLFVLSNAAGPKETLVVGLRSTGTATIDHAQVLLLAVIAAGALGGCIHVATSFSAYVGNARYHATWEWWYMLRPFIGSALAVAFYFLIRGGMLSLVSGSSGTDDPSFYGMVGIAFLVGMFSKQATDKLDDVFDTLFKTDKDDERRDGLESKPPAPRALRPASVEAGAASQKVVISGTHLAGATVRVNGTDHAADRVEDDQIELTLAAADLAQPATHEITVRNAFGAAPNALSFTVTDRRAAGGGAPDDRGAEPAGSATAPVIDLTGVTIQPTPGGGTQPSADAAGSATNGSASSSTDAGIVASDESGGEADTSPSTDAAAATSLAATDAATQPATDDATANAAG